MTKESLKVLTTCPVPRCGTLSSANASADQRSGRSVALGSAMMASTPASASLNQALACMPPH